MSGWELKSCLGWCCWTLMISHYSSLALSMKGHCSKCPNRRGAISTLSTGLKYRRKNVIIVSSYSQYQFSAPIQCYTMWRWWQMWHPDEVAAGGVFSVCVCVCWEGGYLIYLLIVSNSTFQSAALYDRRLWHWPRQWPHGDRMVIWCESSCIQLWSQERCAPTWSYRFYWRGATATTFNNM